MTIIKRRRRIESNLKRKEMKELKIVDMKSTIDSRCILPLGKWQQNSHQNLQITMRQMERFYEFMKRTKF